MRVVWKYKVQPQSPFEVRMPRGAQILHVAAQEHSEQVNLWVLCDDQADVELRRFIVVGTGHPIADGSTLAYVGTFQMERGSLVFHLFEVTS